MTVWSKVSKGLYSNVMLIGEYKLYIYITKETVYNSGIRISKLNSDGQTKGSVFKYENEEIKTYYTLPQITRSIEVLSNNKISSISYNNVLYSYRYIGKLKIKSTLGNWYNYLMYVTKYTLIKQISESMLVLWRPVCLLLNTLHLNSGLLSMLVKCEPLPLLNIIHVLDESLH